MSAVVTTTGRARVVVLSGNPRPASRTQRLGELVAARVAAGVGGDVEVLDLSGLAGDVLAFPAGPALEDALAVAAGADVLVVATPTYKATYTGLLKAFLDRYGNRGLAEVAAVPVQVAANPVHLAAADLHLRPLLLELGARTPTAAVALTEAQLEDAEAHVDRWAATEVPPLAAALPRRA